MINLKIDGISLSLQPRFFAELDKAGFKAIDEPADLTIRVRCPVSQSDVPGEIVHRILEEAERETNHSMAV